MKNAYDLNKHRIREKTGKSKSKSAYDLNEVGGLSDKDVLYESYDRYKDKNGKKAKNIKMRIDSFEAMEEIISGVAHPCKNYSNTLFPETDLCDNCGERRGKHNF